MTGLKIILLDLFINKYNLLYDSQYGFRSKRSCESATLELIGNILDSKNANKHSCALFLDLSKAFDTINHEMLLKKLDLYGIRGICNDWFKNYLTGRSLVCKLNTADKSIIKSDTFNVTYGTTQGSCLGPLLFILYMNDIYLLPTYCRIILFADDTTLYNCHRKIHFLKYMIEHDIDMIIDWFKANQLSLNIEKTVMIKFWPNNSPFKIKIENLTIKNSKSTKFLGIIINENLNWSDHVQNLENKLLSNKRLLLNAKKLLLKATLYHIYYAHIYSHLTYGLTIWGSMITKKLEKTLHKIQTDCLKIMCNKENTTTQNELYLDVGILPFPLLVQQELIKLGYKLCKKLLPNPINTIYKKDGSTSHKYDTRRKEIPIIRKHTDTHFNKSFLCKSLTHYSKLPGITREIDHFGKFKKELKKYLINSMHDMA